MHTSKKALLAAGLIAGAAMMTGCTANVAQVTTPAPQTQQMTAAPATAQPASGGPEAAMDTGMEPEDTPEPIALRVEEKDAAGSALREDGKLMLPLMETAELLGWKADSQKTEEETQTKRIVTLEKDSSRITVSWTVSDNTAKQITWQKDGLLIPVDTRITTVDGTVYVPSAFFEEAMEVSVAETESGISVMQPEPKDTPETEQQVLDGNG